MNFSVTDGILTQAKFFNSVLSTELPVVVTNKKISYYNVPAAFDIEVSSFYNNGEKQACMYIWQFGLFNYVTTGRTWEDFIVFLDILSNVLGLDENHRLIVYVHNLAYEWQFMRKLFKWDKVFFLESRKPVYAIIGGIEFRCSLKLSSKALKKVGEDLQKYKVEKRMGDLDYSLIRTSITPLTEKELGYCEADIRVLLSYIQEKIEQDGDITRIPLTNTGYVRNYCRKACFKRWKQYHNFIKELALEPEEYSQLKRAFQGGFTHASARYSRRKLTSIGSFDFTSSYPAVMVLEKFPMSASKLIQLPITESQFRYYLNKYCCLFDVTFYNLRPLVDYDHPISSSKLIFTDQRKNCVKDNGRVIEAETASLSITEQDFGVYEAFYKWDKMLINNFRIYEKAYLPTLFVKAVLELYRRKTVLKDVEGEEVNYMISKNMVNAAYGMMVTDIVRELFNYIDDVCVAEKPNLDSAIAEYNGNVKRFLFYPWGVWVTSYARKNLFSGIMACKDDYVYSDTDSIKVRNWKKHLDYIEAYNADIDRKIELAAKYHGISVDAFSPLNKKGKAKKIGVWDFEGEYKRFKTVGAKRYIFERHEKDIDPDNGKYRYSLTVAGVNKKKAMEYIEKNYEDPLDGLDEGLIVPGDYSGRLLLDYCGDRPCSGSIVDYTGRVGTYHEESYIHMEPTTYELTYSDDYKRFIDYLLEVKDESW